ncbi:hypothetical protein Ancab_036022 [Ancistrocladus abbreviatus]
MLASRVYSVTGVRCPFPSSILKKCEAERDPPSDNRNQYPSNLPPTPTIPFPFTTTNGSTDILYSTPMMTMDLGMGMILQTSPYVPISLTMGAMAGLDMSTIVAPGICSLGPRDLSKEMAHADSSTNIIIETNKEFDVGGFLTDQVPVEVAETQKHEMMSNDNMIQTLKRLDVENSNFEGLSVTSA